VATVTAVDGNRNTLAGIPVAFSVDGNAIVTPAATVTDSNGLVTATVRIGSDLSNRVLNVSVASGGLTRSKPITVRGATLSASLSPVVTAGALGNAISYKLVDVNGQPMSGQPIVVSAPGVQSGSGVTDINGAFDYTFTAPSAAGQVTVTAVAAGATRESKIDVVAAGSNGVPDAVVVPDGTSPSVSVAVSLSATPSVIPVNAAGSTVNQAQLRALFVGPKNAPVPNVRVRFDLAGNSTSTDGRVAYVGAFAYSDAAGVARGTFIPGQISSPTDGVTVRACWALTDAAFTNNACPNAVTAKLTVASESLSVAIGTDNTVSSGGGGLTYIKKFVVMVVDAAGQARPGVQITPLVDLPRHYKGVFIWDGKAWTQRMSLRRSVVDANGQEIAVPSPENYLWDPTAKAWTLGPATLTPSCPNEDVNRNAVREAPVYVPGSAAPSLADRQEDMNWNGELDSRKASVAITMVGGSTTNASGLAFLQIEYPKSLASWIDALISVTASGIGGSEFKASYTATLPFLAADVAVENVPPAFVRSPFGVSSTCTNTD